jgi:hypothetical protein
MPPKKKKVLKAVTPGPQLGRQRLGGSWFEASRGKKLAETLFQQISLAWWYVLIIPPHMGGHRKEDHGLILQETLFGK